MTTPITSLSRRSLLSLAAAATTAGLLTGCNRFGGSGAGGGSGDINFVWWGDANRAKATQALIDIFLAENEGVTVSTEYQDSGPYSDKLATRFAAGNAPDLFAQRRDSLREYADRGSLLNLLEHSDILDLSGIPEDIRTIGVVGDAMYGVPAGLNAVGFVINKTLTDQYGVEAPDGDTWSWDDFFTMSAAITEASGNKVYGGDIDFGTMQNTIVFIRQTGEDLYNPDDTLGVSAETMTAWFEMSVEQRRTGALPPAGFVETLGGGAAQSYLAKGTIASQIIPTNNMRAYNEAAGGNLQLNRMPGEVQATRRGMSIDTAMYWSVGTRSANADGGLSLLNFIVNSVEGNKAVGATRGVPPNSEVAEATVATLHPDDQRSVAYIDGLAQEELPESRPEPAGGSAIAQVLADCATEVMFERITPAAAGTRFTTEATRILSENRQ